MGELLVEGGIITLEQLARALEEQRHTGEEIGTILVKLGYATKEEVLNCLSEQLGIPYIELGDYSIDPEAISLVPSSLVHKHKAIPVFKIGDVLTLAMTDPRDITVIDEFRRATDLEIEPAIASEADIRQAIEQYYGPSTPLVSSDIDEVIQKIEEEKPREEVDKGPEDLREIAEEAPIVKLVNLIISQAIRDRASDIHIEPEEDCLRVRYRIDGILHEAFSPPKHLQAAITSRIKILAEMDIAKSRTPQDGRFKIKFEDREVDIRVSTLPTAYGENIVLRILDKSSVLINLEELGFADSSLRTFRNMLSSAYGIIFVTGPTGSGKTTTLYAALNSINSVEKNIITIEDPIEYRLRLIRQSQVNPKAGLSFARGLRAILRQDPDVIMVGEIRDSETANIAIQAALTGHLVLTTLHTNDAPGALTRLREMGVEPFLIASATVGVIAQRLVRKICPQCKVEYKPSNGLLKELQLTSAKEKLSFYKGKGCRACKNTGYRGRTGIYEIMPMDDDIRELTLSGASSDVIKTQAIKNGMITLRQDGLLKALKGITTLEEVLRVTNLD